MSDYWNNRFIEEKLMWGTEPSNIATESEKIFKENNAKNILILGVGYGRNGKYFIENGYNVDGIELSEKGIELGKEFCPEINFMHGSVLDMKLNRKYDAIFCYSIIQLFQKNDRITILENCVNNCINNGIVVISGRSTKDKTYGSGNEIEENTFQKNQGRIVHFSTEEEMLHISKKLKNIKIDYSLEKIETKERKEEYNMIYGFYKVNK